MAANTKINLSVQVLETGSEGLGGVKTAPHLWQAVAEWATGTSANQADKVYADVVSLAASSSALDLYGVLADEFGTTINGAELVLVAVKNNSTTSTENITVTSTIAWISGNIVVGPGGFVVWASPIDGVAITNSSADTITLNPGSDTFTADVLVLMRSA